MTGMDEVRSFLDPDEPDYPAAAVALGEDVLPELAELSAGDDPGLASKAVYLAGLIGGDRAPEILREAMGHDDPVVRVAAAGALRNLDDETALDLALELLSDEDAGVRKVTVQSAARLESPEVRSRVREVAESDADEYVRALAKQLDAEELPRKGPDVP